ncbi:DUF4276 family protein [Devosia faecipullorum]|uniref:DUF4276 family protein n=1 Tax=Devosia faecipullorum TaxID=2755039 RepID=UPI00187B94D8|nr:DUF4276 family protein [Devosia faecipullorum]MBE7734368.1 DUF4276 family protein [Devosia faecipullorum]
MHIEILVEDASGENLLKSLLPKILGDHGYPHTWRLHAYKGIGRIPQKLNAVGDPTKRILLDQLPKILRGYGKTPGIDAVVVVLDSDRRNCVDFLNELKALAEGCKPAPNTLFRIAIEEIEAWYFGDREAVQTAYPGAKVNILDNYIQDSVCNTWEMLADAIYPGGSAAIKKAGWPLPGQVKCEWAEKIGPLLEVDCNLSPSFGKFRDGLRHLVADHP